MDLLNPRHLPPLLLEVLLPLLPCFVDPPNKPLQVALVSHPRFMMVARRCIVCNVYIAVLAEILLLGDPVFAHGGRGRQVMAEWRCATRLSIAD